MGIEVVRLVEEVEDDVLEFGLAHRIREMKCWMLSPAGMPCEVYFTRSRSNYLHFSFKTASIKLAQVACLV